MLARFTKPLCVLAAAWCVLPAFGLGLGDLNVRSALDEPLAFLEMHRGPLLLSSYLVTPTVAGPTLHEFLRDDAVSKSRKSELVLRIIEVQNRLAKYGITYGGLHASCFAQRVECVERAGDENFRLVGTIAELQHLDGEFDVDGASRTAL